MHSGIRERVSALWLPAALRHRFSAAQWALGSRLGPRLQLGLKAGLAAGVAWQLALLLPASIDRYAYYAPLGAVVTMYPTLVSTIKSAGQTVLGVGLGAAIATAADLLLQPNALTVALIIVASVVAASVRGLGEQRAWVPVTTLFVFVIGDPGSPAYLIGFSALTLLGATVGAVANLVIFPPLHLRQSRHALESLQEVVVAQLEDIAEGLEHNDQPDPEEWTRRTRQVSPAVSSMRVAISDMQRSRRANPRARRHQETRGSQERQAQAFRRLALMVEELVDLLAEVEQEQIPALPFDTEARLQAAQAIRCIADLARASTGSGGSDEEIRLACEAVEELERLLVTQGGDGGGADPFVASSVVTTLRRCLGALAACGSPTALAQYRARMVG